MPSVNLYIIHYSKLVHREGVFAKIQNMFGNIVKQNNIELNLKIISKFDPDTLNGDFVKRIFDSSEIKGTNEEETELNEKLTLYNKYIIKTPQINFVSNCLKHMDAMNQIAKTANDDDINMIIEDDVVFDSTAETLLTEFIENKKYVMNDNAYDIVFLGLPGQQNQDQDTKKLEVIPVDDVKVLPCCDSYFISKSCAKKLAQTYIPLKFPNNIHLSYLITRESLKVARTFPNIMADGSKVGLTSSSISPNNILIFNTSYKQIYKILDKPVPTVEDINTVEKLLKGNALKNSPDFVFLEGLFYLRTKRYDEAKEQFDKAMIIYETELSPLSSQSAIIQNYIDLCRYIQ
jgi:GR25 family glycosyltransferase involved in LPS biosynthesis